MVKNTIENIDKEMAEVNKKANAKLARLKEKRIKLLAKNANEIYKENKSLKNRLVQLDYSHNINLITCSDSDFKDYVESINEIMNYYKKVASKKNNHIRKHN